MLYYIITGFKNAFRKYKNVAIILFILFITSFLIITQNTMDSFLNSWKKSIIDYNGNMQIAQKGYFKNKLLKSIDFNMNENISFENDLKNILKDNLVSISKNISLNAMLSTNEKSTFVSVNAHSLSHPLSKKFEKELSSGVIIGHKLAKFLNIKENDTLTLMTNGSDGFPNAIGVTISSIQIFASDYANSNMLIAPLKVSKKLLISDKFSKYMIHIKNDNDLDLLFKKVKSLFAKYPNLEVKRWFNIDASFKVASSMFIFLVDVIGYFLWIVMFVVMVFISFLSVEGNIREIGALKAIAIPNTNIVLLFLFEGITISLIGIILGLMIGFGVTNMIYEIGLPFMPPGSSKVAYIRPVFVDSIAINVVLYTFIISFISWSIAIISLLRIPVIKAFRYD